jgi:putative DNA primase/helicase
MNDAPPEVTEDSAALEFAERHRNELRHDHEMGKWFRWNGKFWECAQADRAFAVTSKVWDSDVWLFNTPVGTVDLRTGKMRPHDLQDHITRIAPVVPGGEAPTWLKFLDRVTGGNQELVDYLQRVVGYCITGSIKEHALFFLYGTGANGKSTFLNAITGAIGEYHRAAPIETFTVSPTDRHPTDIAGLRGARLVTAIETEEGRRWAESRIKTLTGGDPVSARFMRQDFFRQHLGGSGMQIRCGRAPAHSGRRDVLCYAAA